MKYSIFPTTHLSGTELPDHAMAARYAPIIQFDNHEPFFPSWVGYTVFRESGPSPSFSREIAVNGNQLPAATVIEYAIWWDWDIHHLYELEHVWVYLDAAGHVIHAEASWHGLYHVVRNGEGTPPLRGGRVVVVAEPGKHALAPTSEWFTGNESEIKMKCGTPGVEGLLVTPLFDGIIRDKSPEVDELVRAYLRPFAFEPSFDFSKEVVIQPERLVPWPSMHAWIPQRITWWVGKLKARTH